MMWLGRRQRLLAGTLALTVGFVTIFFWPSQVAASVTVYTNAFEDKANNATGPQVVFTSDQVGYSFIRKVDHSVAFRKTTDGGASWACPTSCDIDTQTDAAKVVVWYDRWTPGDTTGNNIYVLTSDTGSSDLWYSALNTTNDTFSTIVAITSTPGPVKSNTLTTVNIASITKGTDGILYAGVIDNTSSYVLKCSTTCSTASNWSDAGTSPLTANDSNWLILLPLASGNILVIEHDDSIDDTHSKVWNGSAWDGSWTLTDGLCHINLVQMGHMGATVTLVGTTVYLVSACENTTLGTDDEIRAYSYATGTGVWTAKTTANGCSGGNVLPASDGRGIINAKVGRDENTGDLYALYAVLSTPSDTSTTRLYWKKSTDGMCSWGSEQGPIAGPDQLDNSSVNLSSNERIYALWGQNNGAGTDTFEGATIADLVSNSAPAAPTLTLPASGATGVASRPRFELATTDAQGDYVKYKLKLYANSGGTGQTNCDADSATNLVVTVDQTSSQVSWAAQDQQSATAYTAATTIGSSRTAIYFYQSSDPLLSPSTQYWWKAAAIDPGGINAFGSWASCQGFTTGTNEVRINGGTSIQGGTKIAN